MRKKEFNQNKTTRFAFILKMLLILWLAIPYSCSDDVLDRTPLDSYSDAAVWNDPALISAFISNIYRDFPVDWNTTACLTDEVTRRNNATYDMINAGNLTPGNTQMVNYWYGGTANFGGQGYWSASYYESVSKCNIFFANIDKATFDETLKNRMIGEVKFLRAYAYFRLATIYNGVPLITKTFELDDDFYLPRNTYDECMKFVFDEYEECIPLLPLEYSGNDIGRITKGTVMAAKARAWLYYASPLNNPSNDMTRYQKAADAAKAVIDLGIYSLFPHYRDSYQDYNIYNSEVIWNRLYNNVQYAHMRVELSHWPPGYYGYAHIHPLQNMVDEYERTNGLLPAEDPEYDPHNGQWENRDPRFYFSLFYDGAMFQGREVECFLPGGLDSQDGPIEAWNATTTGYYARKFGNESIIQPRGTNIGNTPWPHFRYNEVLLNYAEAKYFLGDEAACREYINKIRSRPSVDMPPVTASGSELLKKLQHERKVELFLEGHRYFDVRRWKIAPEVLSVDAKRVSIHKDPGTGVKTYEYSTFQVREFPEKMYYLPIPQTEIEKNPNLEQNPGYN
ncbi:MAG: RagB/SusD family nutrient uptake outer membrane protein [Prolixibacteraceae bacterium]|nr:RagB/SusD family nutrient uptake outer membrane protein [Prolixibacteraceae bacterium]